MAGCATWGQSWAVQRGGRGPSIRDIGGLVAILMLRDYDAAHPRHWEGTNRSSRDDGLLALYGYGYMLALTAFLEAGA